MESAEAAINFVVYSQIVDVQDHGFLPKGLNEYFFCKDHPFKIGDKVKIIIKKVPNDAVHRNKSEQTE